MPAKENARQDCLTIVADIYRMIILGWAKPELQEPLDREVFELYQRGGKAIVSVLLK
jgi:hypothetical protein